MAVLNLFACAVVASVMPLVTTPERDVLTPTADALHLALRASDPSDGDTLHASPSRIRLEFTQAVDADAARVTIVSAAGREITAAVTRDANNNRVLLATVPGLESGSYRVRWHVVAPDGHPVSDSFVFYLLLPDAAAQELTDPPSVSVGDDEAGGPPLVASVFRGLAIGCQMALSGVLFFVLWLGPSVTLGLRRVLPGLAGAAVALVVAHAGFWLQSISASGGIGIDAALATATGRMEIARTVLVLLALWAIVLARRPRLALAFATASVVADAAIGHAASIEPLWSIPSKAVHLLAASVWLGGLLAVILGDRQRPDLVAVVRRVSSAALAAVGVIVLTGIVQTILIVPSPLELIGSTYGLLIAGKVLGLGVLIAFGARHRFRLIPALAAGGDAERLRRSVSWEVVTMTVVILVAGLLGYVSPPEPGAASAPELIGRIQ